MRRVDGGDKQQRQHDKVEAIHGKRAQTDTMRMIAHRLASR